MINSRLLPREILFATHEVYEVRAWARAWDQAVASILGPAGGEEREAAIGLLADLTFTSPTVIEQRAFGVQTRASFEQNLAVVWAGLGAEGDHRFKTWRLKNDLLGVEPPCNREAVREYLVAWKKGVRQLDAIVTADTRTLAELLKAFDHAKSAASILITGPTGTGKGILAKAIHELSGRKEYAAENCTAIPATLIESALFGHKRGAFSGATHDQAGIVETVGAGTLFLDEVGDLPAELQPKLLRLLREHEYRIVGDVKTKHTEARFVAATNAEIIARVEKKEFRADLLQRLAACHIELPPLSERNADVDLLTDYFLKKLGHRAGISKETRQLLNRHSWPRNVAELEAAITYAFQAAHGEQLDTMDLPDDVIISAYPPRGEAFEVILAAEAAAATEGASDGGVATDTFEAVLDHQLADPPPVGGDQDLDDLVLAITNVGALFYGEDPVGAAVPLRRAALLAELRPLIEDTPALLPVVDSRLEKTLQEIRGARIGGLTVETLVGLFGSGEESDRTQLREFAAKVKRVSPLLRKVVEAFARASAQAPADRAPLIVPAIEARLRYAKVAGTDWVDPRNRDTIIAALRAARGNKTEAGRLLGIGAKHVAELVKRHGLEGILAEFGAPTNGAPERAD